MGGKNDKNKNDEMASENCFHAVRLQAYGTSVVRYDISLQNLTAPNEFHLHAFSPPSLTVEFKFHSRGGQPKCWKSKAH